MSNSFASVHPELVCEWSEKNLPLTPDKITFGSNKIMWWKGSCGHEWQASVKSSSVGEKCPICSGARVVEGINDLQTLKPEIATEWSDKNLPLLPTQVTAFANRKVWWKCSKGHEWYTLISTRSGGSKCPYCSGMILLKGFNDFVTTHPQLAEEWSERNLPLTPDMVNEKSRRNVWWKCKKCGYEWKSVIYSRVQGTVCPVCAEHTIMTGYNDLATTDPYLLREWDYEKNRNISPERISRNSMRSVWWKCPLGHSWKAKISERTIGKAGCKVCEAEYQSIFPKLVVMFYAQQKKLRVLTDTSDIIGLPIEIYIPDEKLAIETGRQTQEIEELRKYLCQKREIKLLNIPYKVGSGEADYAEKIKRAFVNSKIKITKRRCGQKTGQGKELICILNHKEKRQSSFI